MCFHYFSRCICTCPGVTRQQPVMLQTNQVKVWQGQQQQSSGVSTGQPGVMKAPPVGSSVTSHGGGLGDSSGSGSGAPSGGGGSNIIKIPAGATVSVGGQPQMISSLVMGDNGALYIPPIYTRLCL